MASRPALVRSLRQFTADSFSNFLAGFGGFFDKVTHQNPNLTLLTMEELEKLYRGDWVARKIVDIPAFDATRAWRQWQADKDQIEKLEQCEQEFGLQQKLLLALQRARLYGGSAMVLGVAGTGEFHQELDIDKVKKGSLKFVHVVSRWSLAAGARVKDITSPWFGEPNYYQRSNVPITPAPGNVDPAPVIKELHQGEPDPAFFIHPSRVIRLIGADYPDIDRAMDSWGDSILQVVYEAIRDLSIVNTSVATMISEAKVDVYKIAGLAEHLSTAESSAQLRNRFVNANAAKSVIRGLLLDKDNEEWERPQLNLSNFDKVMQTYEMMACGAADIPATRLFGREPTGMSSTGESDIRNYYDRIASDQKVRLTPLLKPLDEILIRHTFGDRDEAIHYDWNSLWQESDKEKADNEFKIAQAHKVDIDGGLINPDALRQGRENYLIETGVLYPGFDAALDDAHNAGEIEWQPDELEQAEMERKAMEIKNPEALQAAKMKAEGGNGGPPGLPKPDDKKTEDAWSEQAREAALAARHRESDHPTHPLPNTHHDAIFHYDLPDEGGEQQYLKVERRPDGSYYGAGESFDVETETAGEMRAKLMKWRATFGGWDRREGD
jgi:uncharacterized protein